jgi:hypothetical protein
MQHNTKIGEAFQSSFWVGAIKVKAKLELILRRGKVFQRLRNELRRIREKTRLQRRPCFAFNRWSGFNDDATSTEVHLTEAKHAGVGTADFDLFSSPSATLHSLISHSASADSRSTNSKRQLLLSRKSCKESATKTTGIAVKVFTRRLLSAQRNLIAQILCETQ